MWIRMCIIGSEWLGNYAIHMVRNQKERGYNLTLQAVTSLSHFLLLLVHNTSSCQ